MKIGIITFWWSEDNYGQLLQCYALQKYFRDMGHDAFLIRYNYSSDTKKTSLSSKITKLFNFQFLFGRIKMHFVKKRIKKERMLHPRKFEEFRQNYIKQSELYYSKFAELKKNPPDADIYIAGSDQIWNVNSNQENSLPAYFLSFGKKSAKRMSYAASFGVESINPVKREIVKELLKDFSYISVREKKGIEICGSLGYDDIKWDPDPTLLLDASAYRALYKDVEPANSDKKWCFVYIVDNQCKVDFDKIKLWAESKDLNLFYVTGDSASENINTHYPSIPEWLHLIDKAEYVITNSFHGCVFSILFHKKFAAIPLTGSVYVGMNSRLDSLFEKFKINRMLNDDFSVLDDPLDWDEIEKLRKQVINKVKISDYLI